MTALEVSDLAVARGGVAVLEGVSFRVASGGVLVVRGPNGCGKTTLLRTLVGLQPALVGTISAPAEALAYASHADGIKATLSVTENLAFWAAIHGTGAAQVEKARAAMSLEALAQRPAQALSAGQKRRLGLARMLVTGRPFWVLDEPTVSLDADSVQIFAEVIADHLHRGGAALIATHIELGLKQAETLDLAPFRARSPEAGGTRGAFDEAFA